MGNTFVTTPSISTSLSLPRTEIPRPNSVPHLTSPPSTMKYSLAAAALILGASAGPLVPRLQKCEKSHIKYPCGATSSFPYLVKAGDTIYKITDYMNTQKHIEVGVCDIANLNNIKDLNSIQADTYLNIPSNCKTTDDTSCNPPAPPPPASEICTRGPPDSYKVVSGDTLFDIAAKFNITLTGLENANPQFSANFDLIYPGNITHIPVCEHSSCIVIDYPIKSGDIFFDLAPKAGTTVGQIEASNPDVVPNKLSIGQKIHLPTRCHKANEPAEKCSLQECH